MVSSYGGMVVVPRLIVIITVMKLVGYNRENNFVLGLFVVKPDDC
jgi:hypothetical protein